MKKIITITIIIILMSAIVNYYITSHSGFCDANKPFYVERINGKVIDVVSNYDNLKNLNSETVVILLNNNDTVTLFNGHMPFKINMRSNDSIWKNEKTFTFNVYRSDSLVYTTPEYLDCDCSYCK